MGLVDRSLGSQHRRCTH